MSWNYSNTSVETTLTSAASPTDISITIGSTSGLPVTFPYTLILDYGQTNVEVVTVTNISGSTLTVTRGEDGTAAQSHALGATVVHGVVARDLREPQQHIAGTTDVHGVGASSAVVGTTTAQTLTNKTIDGGSNTLTNVPASAVAGSFPSLAVTSTDGGTVAVNVQDNSVTRTSTIAEIYRSNKGLAVDFDGVVSINNTDLNVGTSRSSPSSPPSSRVVVTAALKTGLVVKKDQIADTYDLTQWQDSGTGVVAKMAHDGSLTAANATVNGTLGVTGATTLSGGLTASGGATLTGTTTVNGQATVNRSSGTVIADFTLSNASKARILTDGTVRASKVEITSDGNVAGTSLPRGFINGSTSSPALTGVTALQTALTYSFTPSVTGKYRVVWRVPIDGTVGTWARGSLRRDGVVQDYDSRPCPDAGFVGFARGEARMSLTASTAYSFTLAVERLSTSGTLNSRSDTAIVDIYHVGD